MFHLDRLYVCGQRFRQRETEETLVPRRLVGRVLEGSRRHRLPSLFPQGLEEPRHRGGWLQGSFHHWKPTATRLQTSWQQEELCVVSFPWNMLSQPDTDSRVRLVQTRLVEINLLHVQNRTKTVFAKSKAPERRAKFDPAEAMCQLNRIGHDFSRVQVGQGRFTYKCRLCFLCGERSFLRHLLGKPCSAALHSYVPSPAPVSIPTPDEPESFLIGDTPLSEDDPFGWGGDHDQDHQAMSDQELPLSPLKRIECAEMDFCSSVDPTSCHTLQGSDSQCASSVLDAICTAVERASTSQSYVGFNDGAATAHDNTAGTVFDPGTKGLERPQMPICTVDIYSGDRGPDELAPNPASMSLEQTPRTVHSRERSRSPRRHVDEESFGHTSVHLSHQYGFRDSTLWCWRCGGWSAGSRRASRLKDPCGVPTKTGADVVFRVAGGFHFEARIWRSDDVSGALERIPIIKNQYSNKYRPQACIYCELHWSVSCQAQAFFSRHAYNG